MNDKNSRGKGFESQNIRRISLLACTLIAGFSLTACTPGTNTTSTTANKTYSHETILSPSLKARQAANPHDSKFEVSHEARDKAIAAAKNEKKVTESFYIQLGNVRIKVIPGFHPDHQGDYQFLDRKNKILYYNDSWYDMSHGSEGLAKFHFSAMIDDFTTMWWADTINAETGDNYFSVSNQAWEDEIKNECQFGQQAFMSLIGWPGYETLAWEDYCHKNVHMIPPFPKDF